MSINHFYRNKPICPPYQQKSSTTKLPSQTTLPTYPINLPFQTSLSTHLLNLPSQPSPLVHPHTPSHMTLLWCSPIHIRTTHVLALHLHSPTFHWFTHIPQNYRWRRRHFWTCYIPIFLSFTTLST